MRWPWRRRSAPTAPSGRHMRGAEAPVRDVVTPEALTPGLSQLAGPEAVGVLSADGAVVPTPPAPPVPAPIVSLGFADGQSVALADDDPRVVSFRAAAAAMLGDAPAAPRS
jgi:hypothetical protein